MNNKKKVDPYMDSTKILDRCKTLDGAPTLEVCTNAEWLTEYGGYVERDGDNLDTYAAAEFVGRLRDELTRRMPRSRVCRAEGQRSRCHGWNGAQFTHRIGPVGAWSNLSAGQVAAIEAAIEAART